MSVVYKKLEDVCEILDSRRVPITAKDRKAGTYPYYGANGLQDYVADYIFDDELVLLAEDGGNFGSKERPIAYRVSGKCWVNNHAHVLKAKPNMHVDYLCYALMFYDTEGLVNGATRQKLTQAAMRQMVIPYRDMTAQLQIIKKISQIVRSIEKRKEELQLLDQLVKSRFIELFGDPIKNTQHRPTTAFVNVVTMQRGFDLPVQDRKQSGNIPVYGSNGVLDHHNQAKVCNGGVITGRSGTIGKVFYTTGAYWPLNTTLFSVDIHENNIIYLAHLVRMFNLDRFTEGTGVPTLNRNKFHSAPIIDVPIDEQNQFAAFVEQTDKSKYYSSLSFRYCQAAANTYRQEWMTCLTSDF